MEQRPLEYTVKIYCEGFTEWYYFEWLRTNNRFKFSMEPDIPKNSLFRESILKSQTNREKAIDFSIKHVNTSLLRMRMPITQKCSRLSISSACYRSLQKSGYYWQKNYVPMLPFNQMLRAINL